MKNKNANLSVVLKPLPKEVQAKREKESDRWDEAERQWAITYDDLANRVRNLRAELETYRDQIEAVPFDIASGDIPACVDNLDRHYPIELVQTLDPRAKPLLEMIDNYTEEHGTHEFLDFGSKLFSLASEAADSGYKIGLLSGVIFAGCPTDMIDRFERGLSFAMKQNRGIVKR